MILTLPLQTKQTESLRAATAKLKVRLTAEESRAEAAEKAQFELQALVDEREHIIDVSTYFIYVGGTSRLRRQY